MSAFGTLPSCGICLPDGTYYVDPNGGSVKDAIEVVCRKLEKYDGWFTCVKPSMDKIVSQLCTLSAETFTAFAIGVQFTISWRPHIIVQNSLS